MKYWKHYILIVMTALMSVACSEEEELSEKYVDFGVRVAWRDGLVDKSTRALPNTDLLATGTSDIDISTADYPTTINVHCSDGTDFTLTKGSALCSDHNKYWQYTSSVIYKDKKIERDNLSFSFTATIDEEDVLEGETDKDDISEKTSANQRHLLVSLHHTKALLRFAFKVSGKYDNIRYIRVTGIKLNGNNCQLVDKVLTQEGLFIGYAYIDPTVVTTAYENTIQCTYNIYDKDPSTSSGQVATDDHLTRKDVVAQNKFRLGSLKDAASNPVSTIRAGYYYDLKVTLNPDYLYVLAEHDNKHITIE